MNHPGLDQQQFSLTLSPEPFCSFCLRENPTNLDFFKYATGVFDELRLSFQSVLGYDFQLDNFAICKPCWSLVQLFQDFRTCCQRANGLVERIGRGLGRQGDDGWFGEKNVRAIEGVQKMVQDQLAQIKGFEDVGMIKTEPVEVEEMTCSDDVEVESRMTGSSLELSHVKMQNFEPKLHKVHIKVEGHKVDDTEECNRDASYYEIIEEKLVATEPKNYLPEEDVHQASPEESKESTEERKRMETESEEDEETDNASIVKCRRSGLLKCKQCQRKFDKLRCVKLHLKTCKGTSTTHLLTCNLCEATFTEPRLLQTHINKHEGKTPFQCRKNCTASFVSVQIRNRHEESCSNDRWECTLCKQYISTRNRLFEHYRLNHPGEPRYPCSSCDKRFKRKDALLSHERRIHSEHRAKTETCPICGRKFAEISDLKAHIKIIHGNPQDGRKKSTISCEKCGKEVRRQHALKMHMAAMHPEGTSEENLKAYERRRLRNMEYKRKLKLMKEEENEEMGPMEIEMKQEDEVNAQNLQSQLTP